jgi:MoxR-like ATPase
LAGSKGLGKTFTASVYADAMGYPFERINMSEIVSSDDLLKRVTNAVRKNPFTAILQNFTGAGPPDFKC